MNVIADRLEHRDRMVKGRILDEPTTPALPGYEDAVKQYYLKLANP